MTDMFPLACQPSWIADGGLQHSLGRILKPRLGWEEDCHVYMNSVVDPARYCRLMAPGLCRSFAQAARGQLSWAPL